MSAQHTPGPWKAHGATVYSGDLIVARAPSTYFEELYEGCYAFEGDPYPEGEKVAYANARLIAAAPTMKAELENVRHFLTYHCEASDLRDALLADVTAAIARATEGGAG